MWCFKVASCRLAVGQFVGLALMHETTLVEDVAYSLLGILNSSIPNPRRMR